MAVVLFVVYIPCEDPEQNQYARTPSVHENERTPSIHENEGKPDKLVGKDVDGGGKDKNLFSKALGSLRRSSLRLNASQNNLNKNPEPSPNLGKKNGKHSPGSDCPNSQEDQEPLLQQKSKSSIQMNGLNSGSVRNLNQADENPDADNNTLKGSRFKVSAASGDNTVDPKLREGRRGSCDANVVLDSETKEEPVIEKLTLKQGETQTSLCSYPSSSSSSGYMGEILDALDIDNDVWTQTFDGSQWMIKFTVDSNKCDYVWKRLVTTGFGKYPETSVSVFPTSIYHSAQSRCLQDSTDLSKCQEKTVAKNEFVNSIKSRLTVTQVLGAVMSNATLTFDFIVLIILASIIAGLGLAENSSVVLVASMLISPLMGPIVGFTFGLVVKNRELWKMSLRNELIGLSICLTYGFIFGLITGGINNTGARWGDSGVWPTAEMQARGMLRSLWVGVLIALPSGAGVALSILGGNTGSLVGVAISASLLPPAVNAGMLWGMALISAIHHPPTVPVTTPIDNSSFVASSNCPQLFNNDYKFIYTCHMPSEMAVLGSVSLFLTILNIICIFIMGIIVMKIKEISPLPSSSIGVSAFWQNHLQVYRKAYQTVKGPSGLDMAKMAKDLVKEIRANNPAEGNVDTIVNDLREDPEFNDPALNNELPNKNLFLHQISQENHDMDETDCNMSHLEEVTVENRTYQTLGRESFRVLQQMKNVPEMIMRQKLGDPGTPGSVLRMRYKSAISHPGYDDNSPRRDEFIVIDSNKYVEAHQKRYRRHTALMTPQRHSRSVQEDNDTGPKSPVAIVIESSDEVDKNEEAVSLV